MSIFFIGLDDEIGNICMLYSTCYHIWVKPNMPQYLRQKVLNENAVYYWCWGISNLLGFQMYDILIAQEKNNYYLP